MELEMFAIYG